MFKHAITVQVRKKMTRLQGKLKEKIIKINGKNLAQISNPFIFIGQVHHLHVAVNVKFFVNVGDMFSHGINADI